MESGSEFPHYWKKRCLRTPASFGRMRLIQGEPVMLKSIEGVYRNGRVELAEIPDDVRDETQVIVTFLAPRVVDLRARGIDEAHAAELRARFATIAEDWDSSEMDVYDDYDSAKAKLPTR
jgi:hypothetical protein